MASIALTFPDERSSGPVLAPLGRWLLLATVAGLLLSTVVVQPTAAADHHAGEVANGAHEAGGLHLAVEGLQIVAGVGALAAVGLAGQKFRGGHIEGPLYVAGAGVAVFAFQRLWHNAGEFEVVPEPSALASQGLFLLALLLLAAGFAMLWDAMRSSV